MLFFCSRIPSRYCIKFSCYVSLAVTVSQPFLAFDDLDSVEGSWSATLQNLSDVFVIIRLESFVLRIKTTEVGCHFHHIMDTYYKHDLPLHQLANVKFHRLAELVFLCILHSELLLFSPFPLYSLDASHYAQTTHKK